MPINEPPATNDYVRSRVDGRRGRIYTTYRRYPWNESEIGILLSGVPAPERFLNQAWVGALYTDDRTTVLPVDLFEKIEPFDFRTRSAARYFRDIEVTRIESVNTHREIGTADSDSVISAHTWTWVNYAPLRFNRQDF